MDNKKTLDASNSFFNLGNWVLICTKIIKDMLPEDAQFGSLVKVSMKDVVALTQNALKDFSTKYNELIDQ